MAKSKFLRRKFVKLLTILIFFILLSAAVITITLALILKNLPDPQQLENRKVVQSTKIYDRTGQVMLYEIHGEEKRTVIPFAEIPDYVKKATLAVEDSSFYKHSALDWKSFIRAFTVNLLKRQFVQGGSTITQQLAKNAFLTPEKTIFRKIKELFLAIELEKKYNKDEILNLYLNQIPYGGNAYGIESAAQVFFKKPAKNLTLAEAALLASVTKAPSYYSPWGSHTNELFSRKDYVLEQMMLLGYISKEEKEMAQKDKLKFAPRASGLKAPHFALMVQEYLNTKYGEDFVESAGLNVITTLDWDLQQSAEKAIKEGAERNKNLYQGYNAALVAQDATTGQILSLVGSKDYFAPPEPENCVIGNSCRFEGNFNVVSQGLRQPGSATKPFAYVTAFQKGYSPDSMVFDLPTEFASNNPNCPLIVDFTNEQKDCFHPHNFDNLFRGPVNLRNGLAQSINIPSVKVLYLAGIDDTIKTAQNFGISTLKERSRYGLSLVLGGGEVTLLDLVGAYSVFAQEGVKHQQSFILKITDSKNQTLEEYKNVNKRVIDPQYPRLINDVLSDTNARSPLFSNSLPLTIFSGHDVALKTGTTNDYRDAWAVGYTPDLVIGVWAGNNNNAPMEKQGGSILAAVPIWNNFMKEALKDKPFVAFIKPDPVFNKKAMLRGEYIVNYKLNNKIHPQIHNILFYINKNDPLGPAPENPQNDPQFENWEKPVIEWAKNNILNFENNYNQLLPQGATDKPEESENYQPKIKWFSPQNGSFLKEKETIDVEVEVEADFNISLIELYLNNSLVVSQKPNNEKLSVFRYKLTPLNLEPQNSLKIKVVDIFNNTKESELILFK